MAKDNGVKFFAIENFWGNHFVDEDGKDITDPVLVNKLSRGELFPLKGLKGGHYESNWKCNP